MGAQCWAPLSEVTFQTGDGLGQALKAQVLPRGAGAPKQGHGQGAGGQQGDS